MEYGEKQQGQPPPVYNQPPYPAQQQGQLPPVYNQPPYPSQQPYPPAQQPYPGYSPATNTSATTVVTTQPQTLTVVQGGEIMPSNVGAIVFSCIVTWCCCCVLGIVAFVFASKSSPHILFVQHTCTSTVYIQGVATFCAYHANAS